MRTVLISGASRGIGRAIAERLLKDGHRISLGIRDTSCLRNTALDPLIAGKDRVMLFKYDANIQFSARNWVNESLLYFNGFDTLINCAGIFKGVKLTFKDNEINDINEMLKVNILGPWELTKAAWCQLEKASNGRVIVLVSMSGKRSKGNLAGYTVSKFGLMGLCQTMRNVGWEKGIRVTAICPGWVNTDMAKNIDSINQNEMTQPQDIASICSNILTLPNSSVPFEISVNCILEK